MATLKVNKPESARRQIDAAVRMLFNGGDAVAGELQLGAVAKGLEAQNLKLFQFQQLCTPCARTLNVQGSILARCRTAKRGLRKMGGLLSEIGRLRREQ